MSDIFGGNNTGGEGPSSYDIFQNESFNTAITAINNTIAGSTVNLAPLTARLDSHDLDIIDIGLQMLTKVDKTVYDAKMAEIQTYNDGVDSTFNLIYDSVGVITGEQTTQNNRLTALEGNIASGYVTHAEQYAYATSQQVINESQDTKIDDLYVRIGGPGQTVDLGPLNTRLDSLEAQDIVHTAAINTKATVAYVDFKSNLLQTNIDDKVPLDAYTADLLNTVGRLTAVESTSASNTTAINTKVNTTSFNSQIVSQGSVDSTQNSRLTAIEGTLGNFSTSANRINVTQPEQNLQSWLDADVVVTAGQNIQIGTLEAKVSILEDAVINNPTTVEISQVNGLQTNLTSLQSQITTDTNALATHKTTTGAHTAANISNTPITNLTQSQFTVQKALEAINSRVDLVQINSTGFTSYTNTLLTNWGGAANVLAIPSSMTMPNYVANDETSGTILGNRGSVLWNIDQNLSRTSNSGFKTLRLGSKFPANATALSSSDTAMQTWDFSLSNTITPGSLGSNYYRQNPWRMSYYNPYSSAVETIWSIRGPQFSGDTSGIRMIVDTNMVLTDVSNTISMRFVDMMLGINNNTITVGNNTIAIGNINTTLGNTNTTVSSHSSSIATLTTNVANLQSQVAAINPSNYVVIGSTTSLNQLTCTSNIGSSVDGVLSNGVYFDNQGRIQQRTRTILDASGNIYANRLLGGINNTNEDSLRLFDYTGHLAFSANNQSFSCSTGVLFDSLKNVNANNLNCSSLTQGSVERIDSFGRYILNDNILNADRTRVVVNTLGEINSPYINIVNNQLNGGYAFEVSSSLGKTSYIKYDGECRFGDSLIVNNGISVRGDIVRTDAGTGSFISICRNNIISNIPTLVDVNDIVLGYNNILGGSFNSPFTGQRNSVIVGAGNRTNSSRSTIIGTNNTLENTMLSSFYVLGYGWDMGHLGSQEHPADYVLLGNGLNENANNLVFVTIGGGMRLPTGSTGYSVYLTPQTVENDLYPGNNALSFTRGVSARKYKKEIEEIPTGTFKLDELNPMVYTLKDSNSREVGLIADDLMGTSWQPFVVQMNGEVESLNYSHMITGLVDVIKQQDKKINDLTLRMELMENLIRNYVKLE